MNEELDFEHLRYSVLDWARQRNLLNPENAHKQMLKVTEEVGELAGAIAKNNTEDIIDAVGDTLVTIIILSEQLGVDPIVCLTSAYMTIANRTGKTVDGVFIKD